MVSVRTALLIFFMLNLRYGSIDQLDKADAPSIPETYPFLLALQCLSSIATGFHTAVTVVWQDNSSDGGRALPVLSFNEPVSPKVAPLKADRDMIQAGWPAIFSSLSYFVSTNLDDPLFSDTLTALQNFTITCGILDMVTPRDAFLMSICRLAVPPSIVASVVTSDIVSTEPLPTLGSRNLACLRTLLVVARTLAGTLGSTWHAVFESLQNAEIALSVGANTNKSRKAGSSTALETDDITLALISIGALFDVSKTLDDAAFCGFLSALARLNGEMIEMPVTSSGVLDLEEAEVVMSPSIETADGLSPFERSPAKRRASGIQVMRTMVRSL